jgi:3-isopropylmalate/(R)-2-methylmalate dehydratase small subunit
VSYGTKTIAFELDDYTRWRLMEGLDDIGLTLAQSAAIDTFEASRSSLKPAKKLLKIFHCQALEEFTCSNLKMELFMFT